MTTWKTLSSKILYHSPWLTFYEDAVIQPNGKKGTYAYVKGGPFVLVVTYDGEHFVLVKQYRYSIGEALIEFPGGSIDAHETPLEAANANYRKRPAW